MRKLINPANMSPPASTYNHAVLIDPMKSLLCISGQLGERPDGSCAVGAIEQAKQAWENVMIVLSEANMSLSDVVKVTSYIVDEANIAAYMDVHKDVVGDIKPPWTLVVVAALGRPHYLIEIDVTAAA